MKISASILLPAVVWAGAACGQSSATDSSEPLNDTAKEPAQSAPADTVAEDSVSVEKLAEAIPEADKESRYKTLSDEDFRIVAKQLGVEVAAIKAVVQIEAGKKMEGFYAPGVPVVNFDRSMYNVYAPKAPNKAGVKGAKVPAGLTGYALREWTQLTNARKVNGDGAYMGTFWGMFQIGGFNYKLCGCSSVDEFVKLMSESEFAQLELFARFIVNSGMLNDLKNKNWAGFSRKYNGASYARRGYHTRMAAAYKKFKAQEK